MCAGVSFVVAYATALMVISEVRKSIARVEKLVIKKNKKPSPPATQSDGDVDEHDVVADADDDE